MSDTKDPFKDSFTHDDINTDDAFSQPDPFAGGFDSNLDDDFFKELDKLGDSSDTNNGDELDFLDQLGDTPQNNDNKSPLTQADTGDFVVTDSTPVLDTPEKTAVQDLTADTASVDTTPTIAVSDTDASTVPPVAPATHKKSLFGKNTSKKAGPKAGEQNKLTALIAGALVLLLLLIGAWFLLNRTGDDAQTVITEPTIQTPVAPPEPPIVETVETVAQPPEESAQLPAIDTSTVDVGAIVTAEIPDDPALIKEEIDRLSDKEQRLAEQAKLIDEQLTMMSELTAAKEEQIALLEAQIAQLEAKKQQ